MSARPRYATISFCQTAEALWGKVASGHWDWLGVKSDDRTYVVGNPAASGVRVSASIEARRSGAEDARHVVRTWVPGGGAEPARRELCADAKEAQELFRRICAEVPVNTLVKVERLAGGELVEREFIARIESTYG